MTKDLKLSRPSPIDMKQVASIILGGGEGTRLYPLTLTRCKPAVCFGGKYRLIDVPLSLSINAGCYKSFVLTQFLSSSLHHHIFQTYLHGGKLSESVEILTAEQRPSNKSWFQGTADAVRQNIHYLLESPVDYFLILSGDQLYNLDFHQMVHFAQQTDADVVVATLPVTAQEAGRLGILKVNESHRIIDFYEKPQDKGILQRLRSSADILEQVGLNANHPKSYLGSMGIYLFKRRALVDILEQDAREDFGKHLIPALVEKGQVHAFLYNGYWEDIGTIGTFYEANMALTEPNAAFNLLEQGASIYSCRYDLPPSKMGYTQLKQTILCEGSIVDADEVTHSLLGPRTVIHKGSIIRDSYIMGNDYYHSPVRDHQKLPATPQIGENCMIKRAIIDKNVHIGRGVRLINQEGLTHYNGEGVYIREGITIVSRGTSLPDGFVL
jgi:glucose-1-phosphate adenylyltransferase